MKSARQTLSHGGDERCAVSSPGKDRRDFVAFNVQRVEVQSAGTSVECAENCSVLLRDDGDDV
jgi:hypothetical protein